MAETLKSEDGSSPNEEPVKKLTPAERIEELNNVDKSICSLLGSAVSAMQVLANTTSSTRVDLESQKAAFTAATESYFTTLSEIDVRLRRNVYALEEAGLIAPGDPHRDGKRGAVHSSDVRAGGNGPLDNSWLNARASDSVTRAMDQEIWADARKFVERMQSEGVVKDSQAGGEDSMDVDEGES